jgi:hypothetical protein
MGNTESSPPPPPTPDEIKNQFENAFDPNKNGVAEQFDPNNSNGFLGKVKDGVDNAFQKGGAGNEFLRKVGSGISDVGNITNTIGDVANTVSGGLNMVGLPEFGVPIGMLGSGLKVASPILNKIGDKTNQTVDVIEAPKSDLGKNLPNLIFH